MKHCTVVISISSSRDSSALEFILLRSRSQSRELSDKVSFKAGCSRFYVNVVSTRKIGYLAQYRGLRKFEQFLALSKMFCIFGFELVFVFPTVLCKYRYKCQGLDLS